MTPFWRGVLMGISGRAARTASFAFTAFALGLTIGRGDSSWLLGIWIALTTMYAAVLIPAAWRRDALELQFIIRRERERAK